MNDGESINQGVNHSVAYTGISGTGGSAGPIGYANGTDPSTNAEYSATGTFTSNGLGVLTIDMNDTFNTNQNDGIRLNAFELSSVNATPAPEPNTFVLAALSLLSLGMRRRRRRR